MCVCACDMCVAKNIGGDVSNQSNRLNSQPGKRHTRTSEHFEAASFDSL